MRLNINVKQSAIFGLIVFSLINSGCDNDALDAITPQNTAKATATANASVTEAAAKDAALLNALLEEKQAEINAQIKALNTVLSCVKKLSKEINDRLLPKPSQPALLSSQQLLQTCLELYLPLQVPLQKSANKALLPLLSAIYTTPILPGYVDYLQHYPKSGIVNDITLPITETSLREQQGLTDGAEVSLGFEVIAFLLQGEQRYEASVPPRPVADFTPLLSKPSTTQPNWMFKKTHIERRRLYLRTAMVLLQNDVVSSIKELTQLSAQQ